ncbi:MAG: YgdI/YgdR family lipoprotein [Verrucomicrobiota bacterium]
MKKLFLLVSLAIVMTGCKSRYDVTLSNGTRYTGVSKPKLDKKSGKYQFKMPDGRLGSFYPANMKLIEPHRAAYEFNQTQKK